MSTRLALMGAGLAYGVWETIDIFWIDVPAAAATFAVLFVVCTVWFWRRNSAWAAASLAFLCGFEAVVAPSLKAEMVTKVFDITLGLLGIAAAIGVLIPRLRGRRVVA